MLFASLTLLGIYSYRQLAVELLPNAELPQLSVTVRAPQDMDPAYLETEIVIPLEGAIRSVGGVDEIESQISSNQASITIKFNNNVNIKTTTLRLEEKMKEVTSTILPANFTIRVQSGASILSSTTTSFMTLQVRGTGGVDRVRNIVDEQLLTELENIDGVAAVNVFGGREKTIEIRIDKDAFKALNLTTSSVARLLQNQAQDKVFVGTVKDPENQYFVHVNSTYSRISDLENIVVAPGPILLKDVATVFFDWKEETSYSRVNGMESVSVRLVNDSQANLIDLSNRTKKVIDELNKRMSALDVEIVISSNQADIMERNINDIVWNASLGMLLAIIVLWFFLKNLRLVFFIALSIPISILTAFNLFYAAGISINSLTLVGLALAVGLLLNNSIIVLENIYRLSGTGLKPELAVSQGTTEVWRSIVASTLTTVTVFLPFLFTENFLIKLIGDHVGISIVSTLLVSMAVGLLFIPMVAYAVLRIKNNKSVFYEKMTITQRPVQIYLVLLKASIRNPGVSIFGSVILLFGSLIYSLASNLQTSNEADSDSFNVIVTMSTGSTLESADMVVRVLEDRLTEQEVPELKDLFCNVNAEGAVVTLYLKENYKKKYKRGLAEIQSDVESKLPQLGGTQIRVAGAMGSGGGGMGGGGGSASGMESLMQMFGIGQNSERVLIKGSDYDMMQLVAEDIRYYLSEQDFIRNARVSFPSRQPEVRLNFDQILLSSYEISRNNITTGLSELTSELSSNVTFKVGNESYDIIIREKTPLKQEEEELNSQTTPSIDRLQTVQIANATGGLHSLTDLASISKSYGRSRITRVNQDKQMNVTFAFTREVEQTKTLLEGYRADIDEMIAGYNLPVGIAIEVIHEEDTFADFKFLFLAAFILVFIILACVFESVTTPFVMLFTIPLAAIGSLWAMVLTGNTNLLNPNTLIGFLILLGIVTNNGIILIDYSNILRSRGFRRERALIVAGLSRLRPIIITSITTIVAMFPLAMSDSEYSGAIGAPFAITVIGGLAFSTLLTLIIIPTVAIGLENTVQWYRGLSWKTRIFHLAIVLLGSAFIFTNEKEMIWQAVYFVTLIILVPGVTYFAQTSLRRAKSDVVDKDKEIHIVVSNLVKIYDRPGRFSRQWESGLELRNRLGLTTVFHSLKDFFGLSWQLVVWGFGIYFTYFYLESRTWIFFLSFAIYAATLYLWRKIRTYLFYHFPNSKFIRYLNRILFWGLPPLFLYILYGRLENIALVAIIGALWAIGIIIYISSQYIYANEINIERIKGRMAGFRRAYFRFVLTVPVIGKRRRPFKALKGVSFDIKTGMFGLLGPNGAGKSTFMRIITGILEQSYGSIWINGLDTIEYREELQSLIGFLPQEFGTYENMTAWEFLDYQAILKGLTEKNKRDERIEYVLKSVHMFEKRHHKIGSYSGGMKQRIGIALILLHLPRILVVDEPTAGLDPRERIRFRNLLVELSKERIVIFSTHIIEDISSSCNQVVVINKGEMKYFGDPTEMVDMADGKVWQFLIDKKGFEEKLDKTLVVHNIQDGDLIQVRYLSLTQPYPDAIQMEANLEDAYLCLLKNL
jgi:multidrug efflux pump subunit AcrB/ABC-type multidrug transport system ATPase subunit